MTTADNFNLPKIREMITSTCHKSVEGNHNMLDFDINLETSFHDLVFHHKSHRSYAKPEKHISHCVHLCTFIVIQCPSIFL